MKITVEGMVNTLNGCRIAVAVLWTLLMFTVTSNVSYGDGDVEWGVPCSLRHSRGGRDHWCA